MGYAMSAKGTVKVAFAWTVRVKVRVALLVLGRRDWKNESVQGRAVASGDASKNSEGFSMSIMCVDSRECQSEDMKRSTEQKGKTRRLAVPRSSLYHKLKTCGSLLRQALARTIGFAAMLVFRLRCVQVFRRPTALGYSTRQLVGRSFRTRLADIFRILILESQNWMVCLN